MSSENELDNELSEVLLNALRKMMKEMDEVFNMN